MVVHQRQILGSPHDHPSFFFKRLGRHNLSMYFKAPSRTPALHSGLRTGVARYKGIRVNVVISAFSDAFK